VIIPTEPSSGTIWAGLSVLFGAGAAYHAAGGGLRGVGAAGVDLFKEGVEYETGISLDLVPTRPTRVLGTVDDLPSSAAGKPSFAAGTSAWQPGRYAKSKGWAVERGGYWRARQAGKDVFPTKYNSGLSGQALKKEQTQFFKRGLASGKDPAYLRGQASQAGYTRYDTFEGGDRLAAPFAEQRLQQAIREIEQQAAPARR
jgi:hypothetical protein